MKAKRSVRYVKKMLEEVGIEPERIKMYNIGASDAPLFAQAADQMAEVARNLGPNPVKKEMLV